MLKKTNILPKKYILMGIILVIRNAVVRYTFDIKSLKGVPCLYWTLNWRSGVVIPSGSIDERYSSLVFKIKFKKGEERAATFFLN